MSRRVLALVALIVSLAAPATAQADVTQAASGSGSGTGSATFSLTVPAGSDRLLAVGVSTTDAVTVSSVTFGAQVLTRQLQAAADGARSEIWTLTAPNTGTANVVVTLSGGAPVVAGASSFTGVDPLNPLFPGAASTQNTSGNSASLVLSGTVTRDGMFGTISIANAGNTSGLVTSGSIDLVVADARWATAQGNVRGGGATRSGNTGQNMAQNAGINWRWTFTNPQALNPFAQTLIGLRAGTGTATAPTVASPTATGVTHNSAVLGGNMTGTGGADITQRGVIYCTCATPTVGGAGVTQVNAGASNTTGTFTVNAGGLAASTQYTYRAFATNSAGIGYSAVTNFTTAAPPNQPPTANAGGPYTAAEGAPVTLNGAGSSDPDGNPLTYAWDVDGDGQYDDATGVSPTVSAATLQAIGLGDGPDSASVRVRVNDGTVNADSTATTLTITNVAPSGTFSNSGAVAEGGTAEVSFAAVTDPASADTTAGIRFAYDFNDDGTWDVGGPTYPQATTSSSATVPAAILANGPASPVVRGAVIDKDGGLRSFTTTLTVNNVAPTGTLANRTVDEGATATIGLTGVTDASAGDVAAGLRYAYDFQADGTYDVGSTTYATASTAATADLPAALTADGPATRNVRVAVVDRDGGFTAYTATVTVTNIAPSGTLANNGPVTEGAVAQVSWAGVTDPSAPDAAAGTRYAYDFGNDGTYDIGGDTYATASALAAVDVPAALTADNGAVAVRAVVIDKDGGLRSFTTTVTVTNVAPTGTLANSGPVDEGQTAQVSYSAVTDASAPDVAAGIRYAYDFGNDGTYEIGGGTYATASALATVDVPAGLTADGDDDVDVRAILIDKDGGLRTSTTTVHVANVAPTAAVTGPVAVPSSGAVSLEIDLGDASADDTLSATIDWGDGTTETITGRGKQTVTHTYPRAGDFTVTVVTTDSDGAKSVPATHALSVAAAPAAPAPAPTTTPTTSADTKLTIDGLRVTPRCVRAANLRAVAAQRRTLSVRFRLSTSAPVKFSLERWTGKRGASKCPPATGKAKPGGRKIPGVYSPHTGRTVTARAGVNTVTLAATGRKGRLLRPGTYLLTVTSGTTTSRTKVWVLAN